MNATLSDCRHALRLFARTPFASLTAVVVLAVGIAFVGSFLSLYIDLAIKPPPGFTDGGRLVTISTMDGRTLRMSLIERLTQEVSTLEAVVGIDGMSNVAVGRDGERVTIEYASRGFFDGIRPRLILGRGFEPAEHDVEAEAVVTISAAYWQQRYGGRNDVLGETIQINSVLQDGASVESIDFRIVGVMAPEVRGVNYDVIDIWAPYERILPLMVDDETDYTSAHLRTSLTTIGRLAPGASIRGLVNELEARYPPEAVDLDSPLDAYPGLVRFTAGQRESARQLRLFLVGSVLLALVAAANVSLFLLARAPGRRRELAIRMSVGAPERRLSRQLASEAGLLVVAGSCLGLFVSFWLVNVLRGMDFLRSAEWIDVTLFDWRVLALVAVFMLVLTTLVALAPIIGLRRLGLAASSRQVSAGATLAQRLAGNAQIAIAATFGGAGIAFVWFLAPVLVGDPGYSIDDRYQLVFLADGSGTGSPLGVMRRREIVESLPAVRAVTVTWEAGQRLVLDPSDPAREIPFDLNLIDGRFLDVLGFRLLFGRAPADNEVGAALVNESFARRLFARANVVGEVIEFAAAIGPPATIVGVVQDTHYNRHPSAVVEPSLYVVSETPPPVFLGIVHSPAPPAELQRQLSGLIESGALETGRLGFPLFNSLTDMWADRVAPDKARGLLTVVTAGIVVLIAAFGFYGTQRYLVSAGRREYAIRASLGAGPAALGRLVFVRGLRLGPPGLTVGAMFSFILIAWIRDDYLSRDVVPAAVTAAAVIAMELLMLAASYGPARQARRTGPAPLLREG